MQMKLFGNSKSSQAARKVKSAPAAPLIEEEQPEEEESKLQPRTRALILMLGAICLFAGVVVMCLTLIRQSAKVNALPQEDPKAIDYLVNVLPPVTEDIPEELTAPKSLYNSSRLNFLLIGIDDATDLTNMLILASVDLHSKDVAFLSIPRETYVSGNLDHPAACNIYKEADGGNRGIKAVREKVKEMIGFWPDYYFVFNAKSLNGLLELTGSIEFEVPSAPAYSDLSAGTQSINGASAVKLLNYKNGYRTISTEPTGVQRNFLQTLLTVLLQDVDHIEENARAIAAFADTDLSSDDLAYLGHFLKGKDMKAIYSRALPGEAIEADEGEFYQVDPADAADILNENFNPLDEDLTIYDLNFRQLAGDSGVGTYDPYGFGNGGNNSSNNNQNNTNHDNEDETEETEETEDTEETNPDDTEATETPEETEEPVETGETEDPQPPVDPELPLVPGETTPETP